MLAKHSKIILVHSCSLPFSLCLSLPYSIVISYFRPFCLSAPSVDLHPQLSGSDRQPACHLTCLIAYRLLAVNSPIRNCVHSPLLLLTAALQREEEKERKERKRGSGWEKGESERGIQSAFALKGTGPSFICKACSNSLHLNEVEQDWLCSCSGSCVLVCVRAETFSSVSVSLLMERRVGWGRGPAWRPDRETVAITLTALLLSFNRLFTSQTLQPQVSRGETAPSKDDQINYISERLGYEPH